MGFQETYDYYMIDYADARTNDWPLVKSPVPVLTIIAAYLLFVFVIGPIYMRNRKPYDLSAFVRWYNTVKIISNGIIVYFIVHSGWLHKNGVSCVPLDYSLSPQSILITHVTWWSYIDRLCDLIETIVFTLRKKRSQITFLHVYHHLFVVILGWLTLKYGSCGMNTMTTLVNSAVHFVMYSYYLMSNIQKLKPISQFIKSYITILQMIQFFGLLFYYLQTLSPSCDFDRLPSLTYAATMLIFLYLFYKFYRKSNSQSKKVR